jgi:lipopolysaccharide transport system permease protein
MRETVIQAGAAPRLALYLKDLWRYRHLIGVFCLRDIKTRYTQTILGVGWVLLTPLMTVGVFSFVFGLLIKVPSDGLPYLLFYLVAIIPWYAFINTLNNAVTSIEANSGLISKIYFPRLLIGASHAVSALVDFMVGYLLIIGFAAYFGFLTFTLFLITPLLLLIQTGFALGIGYFLAPLNTRYRDVKLSVPLAAQLFYYASPIMYPSSVAPAWAKPWFNINPFSVVINGYRKALLGEVFNWPYLLLGLIVSMIVLAIGAAFFISREQDLVDVL